MKRIIAILVLAIAAPSLVLGQAMDKKSTASGKPKMSANEKVTQDILKLQQEWLTGLLKGDPSAAKRILADDYLATTQNGTVNDKTQTLANIRPASSTAESPTVSDDDSKIRFYGNTAVSTGRLIFKTSAGSLSLRYTITFVKQRGQWQAVSSHVSTVPQ
ncbi:MAG: nuclear transport factor 2 family protein [Acidobacteriota bacterium]|nr:MAG: nuclear transport factor 2 family protein [Acidobacteriota bacterium]